MGRKNLSAQRRKEIIVSFYEAACDLGLENTSIDKVAKHMNITKGLVLHYFKNREKLLIGLNEYILEQHLHVMNTQSSEAVDTPEKLKSYIEQLFSRSWNNYFDDGVFYSCYALIYRMPAFKDSFRSYLIALHQTLYQVLAKAAEAGVISAEALTEKTEVIFALVDGAYYYMGMFDETEDGYSKKIGLYTRQCLSILAID